MCYLAGFGVIFVLFLSCICIYLYLYKSVIISICVLSVYMYVSVDGRIFDAMTAHYNVSPCMFFLRNEVFLAISFRHVYIYKM